MSYHDFALRMRTHKNDKRAIYQVGAKQKQKIEKNYLSGDASSQIEIFCFILSE